AVADGQRQYRWFGTDGAGFIDQYHVRRMGQARQVGGLGRQADADEADAAIAEATRSGHRHHFVGGVGHHWASCCAASLAWNALKSAVPRMNSSIQAVKDSRLRAIGSHA